MYLAPPSALLFSKQIGQDLIATESGTLQFTGGTLQGTGTVTVTAFIQPNEPETYVANWSSTSATVNGRTGTVTMYFDGTDNGHYGGNFVAIGSGGLTGFSGEGSYSGTDSTGLGTYTLTYVG